MTSSVIIIGILFYLCFVSYSCEGKITIVNGGNTRYALSGENVTIQWKFDLDPADVFSRTWTLITTKPEIIASISYDQGVTKLPNILPKFDVTKPATLVLINVDDSYNGTYHFVLTPKSGLQRNSYVTFSIAVQPTVTINCSSSITVIESDTVRCQCKGEGGNPRANVTWYKDEKQIDVAGDEEKLLTLNNVNETKNETYKCVAQSYTLKANKSINIIVHFKPNVAINCSSNITVNESDSVRCLCEGKGGYPPANVAWYKNGEMIGDAGYEEKMLTFNNIDETKIGIYECVAQSSNLRAKESIRIIVHFKPTVTNLTFSPKVVGIGENVTIECKASGYPAPSYTITLNDTRVLSNQMTYELTNLNSSHVGSIITCTATNILGNDSRSERLPLAVRPNVTINCPSTITVNESDSVGCLCEGKGGYPPANVTWYDKGGEMIDDAGDEEKMLTLNNVNETNNGTYECVAQSYNLQDKESIQIIVNFKPTVTSLTFTPKVVHIGENVTIECKASGYPAPSYTITLNDTLVVSNQMMYEFTNLNTSHVGSIITCTATNILGSDSRSERLPLKVKPNVAIKCRSTITVNETDSVRCLCKGKGGYPPPNVTWYDKDNKMIGDAGDEEKMLTLKNVNERNNGTYKCVAQSYTLTDEKSITIIVRFKPKVTSLTFSPKVVHIGENVTIECKASGYPAPSYTITLDDKLVLSNQMMYEFTNLKTSLAGSIITCTAANYLGNDSRSKGLPLKVRPNVTINCSSTFTVNERGSVRCLCEGKGGYPPANVTWYDKDGKMIGDAGDEEKMLTLNNIDETKIGTYKCVAQSYNLQDEESIQIIIHFAPVVTSFTSKPDPAVLGQSVIITCEASARPSPNYVIFHNCTEIQNSPENTYTITNLKYNDTGLYKCIAKNKIGTSEPKYSFVTVKEKAVSNKSNGETKWYIVVVSLVSGIVIGILLSYIFGYSRRQFRNRKPRSNPSEPVTSKDNTIYQDLDLSKMNSEDNYQSLRVNSGRSDAEYENQNDSTYTDLNKVRDVENNYQSLT